MIKTPKMWGISQRIQFLESLRARARSNDAVEFELQELRFKYRKLDRIERLGLKLVKGSLDASNPWPLKEGIN